MTTTATHLDADTVFAELRAAVVIVCEVAPDSLSLATRLDADLEADSLALVEIIDITEAALVPLARPGFHFDDGELDNLVTLGDVVEHALRQNLLA